MNHIPTQKPLAVSALSLSKLSKLLMTAFALSLSVTTMTAHADSPAVYSAQDEQAYNAFKAKLDALPTTKNTVEIEARSLALWMYKDYATELDMFVNEYSTSVQNKYGNTLKDPATDSFRYGIIAYNEWMYERENSRYFNPSLISEATLNHIKASYARSSGVDPSEVLSGVIKIEEEKMAAEAMQAAQAIAESRRRTEENRRITEENRRRTEENRRRTEENRRRTEENRRITEENRRITEENRAENEKYLSILRQMGVKK